MRKKITDNFYLWTFIFLAAVTVYSCWPTNSLSYRVEDKHPEIPKREETKDPEFSEVVAICNDLVPHVKRKINGDIRSCKSSWEEGVRRRTELRKKLSKEEFQLVSRMEGSPLCPREIEDNTIIRSCMSYLALIYSGRYNHIPSEYGGVGRF